MSDSLRTCSGVSAAELSTVLDLISGTDISELDITSGKTRLSLRRPAIVAAPSSTAATAPAVEPHSLAITSPLVGIFHASVATGDILQPGQSDRKSTRLNSSHDQISYAVFCLKK